MGREDKPTTSATADSAQRGMSPIAMMGQLLKLSNLITRPFFVFLAGPLSLNHNELRVLMTLASMREAAAHEIARAAGMHPMNVSRAVASLTRARRITARRDVDGRRKILALTSEGQELQKALLPHIRRVADVLCESMTPLEIEFFAKLLSKLVEHLDTLSPTDPKLVDAAALTEATESLPRVSKPRRSSLKPSKESARVVRESGEHREVDTRERQPVTTPERGTQRSARDLPNNGLHTRKKNAA